MGWSLQAEETCWSSCAIKMKRSKKPRSGSQDDILMVFVNAGSSVLCRLPEPNIFYDLKKIFFLEFPAAEFSWLLLWRRISWFPVDFLQQQLDLSWLLGLPLPAVSALRSLCGYLGSKLGENLVVWEFLWASSAGPNIFLLKHDGHAGSQETPQLCE